MKLQMNMHGIVMAPVNDLKKSLKFFEMANFYKPYLELFHMFLFAA